MVKMRKRRGAALHWVAASGVAVVLGGVAYLVTQDSTSAAGRSAAVTPPTTPAPAPAPAAARAPTPAPTPPKPVHVEPPAPAPPTEVRVRIITHPPDAAVMLDGKKFGRTPLDETLPIDRGKHMFVVKRRGFKTHTFDASLDADIIRDFALTPMR